VKIALVVLGALWVASSIATQQLRTTWTAPARAAVRQSPLSGRTDVLGGGKKVFEERCAACHRHDGSGTNRGSNLSIRPVQAQSDGALFWKISSGNTRTGMPSFSFLPEPQRWQLVAYVRSLAN
jgi:mono/diheme cytochrome c family protein